jgi:hypothetical protein
MQTRTTTKKGAQKGTHGEAEKREGHATDPPSLALNERDNNIGALQAMDSSA